jgi:hypothetical protein
LVFFLLFTAEQARAQDAVQLCREKGTDDDVRPIQQSLVPAAKRIFGLKMPDQQVMHSTVFRCADGHVLLCTYGANLPCGKANSDRDLPGAEAWCRDHPNAEFVPRFAIPWGNIYMGAALAAAPRLSSKSRRSIPTVLLPATGSRRIERHLSTDCTKILTNESSSTRSSNTCRARQSDLLGIYYLAGASCGYCSRPASLVADASGETAWRGKRWGEREATGVRTTDLSA